MVINHNNEDNVVWDSNNDNDKYNNDINTKNADNSTKNSYKNKKIIMEIIQLEIKTI